MVQMHDSPVWFNDDNGMILSQDRVVTESVIGVTNMGRMETGSSIRVLQTS